jgi:hypothetical protein
MGVAEYQKGQRVGVAASRRDELVFGCLAEAVYAPDAQLA